MAAATTQSTADLHMTTSPDDTALRDSHDERFYAKGVPEVPALAKDVLTNYAKIPEEKLQQHAAELRDRAYAISPYPCIGRYRFLTFSSAAHPLLEAHVLPTLLEGAKSSSKEDALPDISSSPPLPSPTPSPSEPIYMDIGTCLGQDLRLLLHRGVPPSRVFGTDVEPAFFPLGYELFQDKDHFPQEHQLAPVNLFDDSLFVAASAPADPPVKSAGVLAPFSERVDILHISAVFHLFSYNDQILVGKRVLSLMRSPQSNRKPAVVFGCQTAHADGKEYPQRVNGKGEMLFRHNAKTWETMWTRHVIPGGVVTFSDGAKARLRFNTDMDEPRGNLPGLVGAVNDKGDRRADPHFKWMKFEVWLDPID